MKFKQINKGENGGAVTFLEDSNRDFLKLKMLDIRRLNQNNTEEVLSIYGFSRLCKEIVFNNRQDALKYALNFMKVRK